MKRYTLPLSLSLSLSFFHLLPAYTEFAENYNFVSQRCFKRRLQRRVNQDFPWKANDTFQISQADAVSSGYAEWNLNKSGHQNRGHFPFT